MPRELTTRQSEVLGFVDAFIAESCFPPTIREVATNFDCSVKAAYDHIEALRRKGYLLRTAKRSRSMVLTADAKKVLGTADDLSIPLFESIAAGFPRFATDTPSATFTMPFAVPDAQNYFACKVEGDSMIGAGILNGDIAIIRRQADADNNTIVAVQIGDEVTLKYLHKKDGKVTLKSANPRYPPIAVKNCRILGKLVGVYRIV